MPYEWVPNEPDTFFKRISRLAVAKKYLHRRLVMTGQSGRETFRIGPNQRVLWIYYGKHSIGDAVMDLSGRALLRDRPGPVDLLTTSSLKALFEDDDVFRHVYDGGDRLDPDDYDIILVHEFNYPTVRLKKRRFRKMPFASLFRYYVAGPDRNSTQFSFAAINAVFGLGLACDALSAMAKPYLRAESELPQALAAKIAPLGPFLAIGVGGIEPRRTYAHWDACLQAYDEALRPGMPRGVVLLGSDNGKATAQDLIASGRFANLKLVSLVGELTLRNSKRVIANSQLYVGADGGLMHVAHTTPTPSVTIFAEAEPSHLRITPRCHSTPLQTESDVSAADPRELAQAIVNRLTDAGMDCPATTRTTKARKEVRLRLLTDIARESQLLVRDIRNEENVRKWMYTDHEIGLNEHLGWIDRLRHDDRQMVFAVLQGNDAPLGVVSLNAIDRLHKKADWAYYLAETARGGLGAALEFEFIDFVFSELPIEKLNCEVIEGNDAVVKLHRKFLFREEGFRHSNILKNGRRIGVHFLGLIKEDWQRGKEELQSNYGGLFEKFSVSIEVARNSVSKAECG